MEYLICTALIGVLFYLIGFKKGEKYAADKIFDHTESEMPAPVKLAAKRLNDKDILNAEVIE